MTPQPRVQEFIKHMQLLMSSAPQGYQPWLLRLEIGGKNPISTVNWKKESARLTINQAIDYMRHGGNIGIAGTSNDNLVLVDCDGKGIKDSEVKPTLIIRSRSRIGRHGDYWDFSTLKCPNIPTDDDGEVRSKWQYVVAAGSYVPVTEEELERIPIEDRVNAGYYTVDNAVSPAIITFDELPQVFKETWQRKHSSMKPRENKTTNFKLPEKHSKLFDVTVFDIYRKIKQTNELPLETERWGSLFHDSKTGANMSITTDGLLHCWRHSYSFNALQSLAVLSGYMKCDQAGTPHSNSDYGSLESEIIGDNGAIFFAWKYAKEQGYIPLDDPIPVKAMYYIADKHLHYRAKEGERLPANIYRQVIKIVEDSY